MALFLCRHWRHCLQGPRRWRTRAKEDWRPDTVRAPRPPCTVAPNDPVALSRLAEIQIRDGAVDEALKSYEKVVATNPQFAPATRRLAVLYRERNVEDQKAFELTEKARQAYPQDPNIARVLGILNYRRQYYPRAAELLQEAARARADDPELQFYLGAAHYQLKQWNQCKAVLERALSLNPVPKLAEEAKRISAECSEMSPQ